VSSIGAIPISLSALEPPMLPRSVPCSRALHLCVWGLLLSVALCFPAQAQSVPTPRFDGAATLTKTPPRSADGRFALQAQLKPVAAEADNGRFHLSAALRPDVSAGTLCAPLTDDIFSDGFE
jgi:hypothetical protein